MKHQLILTDEEAEEYLNIKDEFGAILKESIKELSIWRDIGYFMLGGVVATIAWLGISFISFIWGS